MKELIYEIKDGEKVIARASIEVSEKLNFRKFCLALGNHIERYLKKFDSGRE